MIRLLMAAAFGCLSTWHPLQWSDAFVAADQWYPYCWQPDMLWKKGDLNIDGEITVEDLNWFECCRSGPNVAYVNAYHGSSMNCGLADFDGDGDVDQDDFGWLQARIRK